MSELITLDGGEVLDLSAYPLPEGVKDEILNLEDLAESMRTSTNTIRKWISQGMPVKQNGSNGQAYELQFSHCYAWRLWIDEKAAASRRALSARNSERAQLFLGIDDPAQSAGMTPKEVREWSEAELIRNKAALQRGELVRAFQVQEVFDGLLVATRNVITSAPDYLEQEFSLTPAQVVKAEEYFDALLSELRKQIAAAGFVPAAVVSLQDRADLG